MEKFFSYKVDDDKNPFQEHKKGYLTIRGGERERERDNTKEKRRKKGEQKGVGIRSISKKKKKKSSSQSHSWDQEQLNPALKEKRTKRTVKVSMRNESEIFGLNENEYLNGREKSYSHSLMKTEKHPQFQLTNDAKIGKISIENRQFLALIYHADMVARNPR